MSISSISGTSVQSLREQLQAFRQGKTNLQKEDLTAIQDKVQSGGSRAEAVVEDLSANFEKIDQNKDGISFEELKDYVNSQDGPTAPEGGTGKAGRHGGPRPNGMGNMGGPGGMPPSLMLVVPGEKSGGTQAQGISKEALEGLKSKLEEGGMEIPKALQDLIDAFDKLDSDQDGTLTLSELVAQAKKKDSGTSDATGEAAEAAPTDEAQANGGTQTTIQISLTTSSSAESSQADETSQANEADQAKETDRTAASQTAQGGDARKANAVVNMLSRALSRSEGQESSNPEGGSSSAQMARAASSYRMTYTAQYSVSTESAYQVTA